MAEFIDVICVIFVIYVIYDIHDIYGALTYTICMYVNMGVKRSVRTSGMQPTILDILHNYFPFVCFRSSFVYFAAVFEQIK